VWAQSPLPEVVFGFGNSLNNICAQRPFHFPDHSDTSNGEISDKYSIRNDAASQQQALAISLILGYG
jgi:hypothetical protein